MARGNFRVYLGAAPGVGKTFAMLNEGWRRRQRGTDVVVGYVETHGRPNTAAQLRDLEVIPRVTRSYRDQSFAEMDLEAILARQPAVVLVDELAHTNVGGSDHEKRWHDVETLLDAGIDVITTVNIQHLESLNDVVQRITAVVQSETLPDRVVRAADQVELVDMAPEALRRRMAHGNIYRPDVVDTALGNYFRLGNLAALRELALLWLADKVDENLNDYRQRHNIAQPWELRERVVVALTGSPQGGRLIRRAARMAARTRAELVGLHIRSTDGLAEPSRDHLDAHRALVVELGGRYEQISAADVPTALVDFARAENATQLVLGSSGRSRWSETLRGSVINQVIRAARELDVHVISTAGGEPDDVAQPEPRAPERMSALPYRRLVLPRRRVLWGWLLAVALAPAVALALIPLRPQIHSTGALALLLAVTLAVATIGGLFPGVVCALIGFSLADWYFIPPLHHWDINGGGNVVALVVFVGIGVAASAFAERFAARRLQLLQVASESEALARLAGGALLVGPEAFSHLVADIRSTFGLDAAAVLTPIVEHTPSGTVERGYHVQASAGQPVPASPEESQYSTDLGDGVVLVLSGSRLESTDRRLLSAFVAQLRLARAQRDLQARADSARALAKADELRNVLLSAVSHDLRTPLATIKAAASSVLSTEIDWDAAQVREFCAVIEYEADRLNTLVGNLLDMSRLQAGVLPLTITSVALEEVVFAAVGSLGHSAARVDIDVPEGLPAVAVDAALLERALANLIDNALSFSPTPQSIRVEAGAYDDRVDLRIVDRGPGIPEAEREVATTPFRQQGDGGRPARTGLGLGLAVAKGFVHAMGGELELEDTPGGGLTVVIGLPAAARLSLSAAPPPVR